MFWQMSRVLRGGGAIGSLQPSEVTVSVTVQGRSEMEMEAEGGGEKWGRGVIPVSNPAAGTRGDQSPAFYGLATLPPLRRAASATPWIKGAPRLEHFPRGRNSVQLRRAEN